MVRGTTQLCIPAGGAEEGVGGQAIEQPSDMLRRRMPQNQQPVNAPRKSLGSIKHYYIRVSYDYAVTTTTGLSSQSRHQKQITTPRLSKGGLVARDPRGRCGPCVTLFRSKATHHNEPRRPVKDAAAVMAQPARRGALFRPCALLRFLSV